MVSILHEKHTHLVVYRESLYSWYLTELKPSLAKDSLVFKV